MVTLLEVDSVPVPDDERVVLALPEYHLDPELCAHPVVDVDFWFPIVLMGREACPVPGFAFDEATEEPVCFVCLFHHVVDLPLVGRAPGFYRSRFDKPLDEGLVLQFRRG